MDNFLLKIVNLGTLKDLIIKFREKGKKIIWANGCFDILHIGHLKYLQKAKDLGDILIVGVNSDESVRKLKGDERPVNMVEARVELIAALECVDFVIVYPDLNVIKYLNVLRPDFYVKGDDYCLETINREERKAVESYGGKICFVGNKIKISTTEIINRIRI